MYQKVKEHQAVERLKKLNPSLQEKDKEIEDEEIKDDLNFVVEGLKEAIERNSNKDEIFQILINHESKLDSIVQDVSSMLRSKYLKTTQTKRVMNNLVEILSDDFGEPRDEDLQYWHLVWNDCGAQTFCQGEFFGKGESGCEYEVKSVKKGGITCPECLFKIKEIKKIKL